MSMVLNESGPGSGSYCQGNVKIRFTACQSLCLFLVSWSFCFRLLGARITDVMVGISCQFDRSSGHLEGGPLGLWGIILIVLRWRYQDQLTVCGIIPGPGSWTVKNRESELSTASITFCFPVTDAVWPATLATCTDRVHSWIMRKKNLSSSNCFCQSIFFFTNRQRN